MKNSLTLVLPLLLAACGSDKAAHACPQVAAVRELAQITDFGRDETLGLNSMVAAAKIDSIDGDCAFRSTNIDTDFDVHLTARRGSGLGGNQAEFPYFVAVLDQNNIPVSKQNLSTVMRFSGKDTTVESVEKIHVKIPTEANNAGEWRVLVGFQLTPEQLAYNRQKGRTP